MSQGSTADNVAKFYFAEPGKVWADKLGRFVLECNKASEGAIIRRLEQRFDRIYIDEVQDLAGYDLDLVELLLKSKIKVTLVGDHRQATFRTNNASKNSPYKGIKIIDKFKEWEAAGLATVKYLSETRRCHRAIATFADGFFPVEPETKSLQGKLTGHDGVFVIPPSDVAQYVTTYAPQVLRLDRRTRCQGYNALNFGESKGMTFDRVLIFPHKSGRDWLSSGDCQHVAGAVAKLYVGVTRARHSVTGQTAWCGDVHGDGQNLAPYSLTSLASTLSASSCVSLRMPSERHARPTSRARPMKAGGWSRRPTTMAVCLVAICSGQH